MLWITLSCKCPLQNGLSSHVGRMNWNNGEFMDIYDDGLHDSGDRNYQMALVPDLADRSMNSREGTFRNTYELADVYIRTHAGFGRGLAQGLKCLNFVGIEGTRPSGEANEA